MKNIELLTKIIQAEESQIAEDFEFDGDFYGHSKCGCDEMVREKLISKSDCIENELLKNTEFMEANPDLEELEFDDDIRDFIETGKFDKATAEMEKQKFKFGMK